MMYVCYSMLICLYDRDVDKWLIVLLTELIPCFLQFDEGIGFDVMECME